MYLQSPLNSTPYPPLSAFLGYRSMLVAMPLVALLGCAPGTSERGRLAAMHSAGGVVIQGEELHRFNGRLLDGLRARISTMQVTRRSGGCPQVVLRGLRTIIGSPQPEVYVDGTRMNDTCILDQIRTLEVKRVEVYAGAGAGRTGYSTNANGLIAVFLVDGLQ